MPVVVHLLNAYLPPTETFVWQYLRQAKRFMPCILADRYEHLDRFPLPGGEEALMRLTLKRGFLQRSWSALRGGYASVHYAGAVQALRQRGAVLAHAHQGFRAIVTQKLLRDAKLPFVASFYGSDVSRQDILRRGRSGYREVFARASALCAEGPKLRRRLLDLGASEAKVRLVRIAIDIGDYAFATRHWDGATPLHFLFVGRLVEKKGLAYALDALAALRRRDGAPDFKLTVVGDGPLRAQMSAKVADLGLRSHVDFKGLQSLTVLRELMAGHHALLAPSCTAADGDSEGGAPTVLLEAQACGLPVLATTHDDIPFVTVPGKSALLAPEHDAAAFGEILERFIASPEKWEAMGRAGREHVAAHHDARIAIDNLEAIYADALGA
jgi:colanic acid/amylovoran biosynthesis glycosyltransferase